MRRYTCIGEPKLFPPLFVSFVSLVYYDVKRTAVVFSPRLCVIYLSSIYECDEWVLFNFLFIFLCLPPLGVA